MSRRRLYYLLDVGRLVDRYAISKADAERVGWTKLQIIARHVSIGKQVSPNEIAEWIALAKQATVRALPGALRGDGPNPTRGVVFHLTKKERVELKDALLAFGAKPARRGLAGKEQALTKIIRAALVQK